MVRSDDPGFATVADELLAVSKVLGESSALRGALADAGTSAERKQALVRDLFGPGLSELTVEVLQDVAARRWSSPADLNDAVEQLGAEALFVIAERAGTLDTIEDDLFRFARIVEAEPQLSAALGDLSIPGAQRAKVVTDLLQGKVDPTTVKLVSHVVANPRGRRVEHALEQLSQLAAERRDQLVATIRTAVELTPQQYQRLGEALARVYGREVHLQVSVDPSVVGGVVVQVGDEVIDGSIATKLEQARRRLTA